MIQYNGQNQIKEVHYDGHDIKYVYGGCSSDLVWQKHTPAPSDWKYKLILSDSTVIYGECDEYSAITKSEVSAYSSTCVSVEIGNCTQRIEGFAFGGFKNTLTVTIPDNVARINHDAFASCYSLTSVTVLATTPPFLESGVFSNTNNCPIYVPRAQVDVYKAASGWSAYKSRIEAAS